MKINRNWMLIGLGPAIVCLAGCAGAAATSSMPPLEDTAWTDAGWTVSQPLTLQFRGRNDIGGFSGCNRYSASVQWQAQAQAQVLRLGPIATTRMLCEPLAMSLETRFLQALQSTRNWNVEDGHLLLFDAQGQILWRLKKKPA
jgi:heat shock protein HslJ